MSRFPRRLLRSARLRRGVWWQGWGVAHSSQPRNPGARCAGLDVGCAVICERSWSMRCRFRAVVAGWLTAGLLLAAALLPGSATAAGSACRLQGPAGPVSHVVYIQFDNVHFRRDNPNVPSDLEQMPHLLSFLENGTLLTTSTP